VAAGNSSMGDIVMSEWLIPDFEHLKRELPRLPPRKRRGHKDNLLRAIAGGYIFMGYDADTAIARAREFIRVMDLKYGGESNGRRI